MENRQQNFNPWISIWLNPRTTIQKIIETDPEGLNIVLASLAGVSQVLARASGSGKGDHLSLPVILLIAALLGPIGGIITFYISSRLIHWTGKWIDGRSSATNIEAAIAWSYVPVIWSLLLWVPKIILFGEESFTSRTPMVSNNGVLHFAFLGFTVIDLVIGVWTLVIVVSVLSQVQKFSIWKAIANIILPFIVVGVPILIIIGLFSLVR